MPADPMNPVTAVTWGPFIQAAYEQFVSHPGQVNPAAIANMPAAYTLVRTIQMTDFLGPAQSRVFYGFVAVGGAPKTAVVALRGTATKMEWWDDFHWDLVPFTQIPGGGKVARGFCDIYDTFGTMTPGQQHSTPAPATFAARYGALSTVSWRIYNQVDVVPYFPVDTAGSYQPVTTGYAINSLGKAKWSLGCAHALNTYMHVLSPATVPLDPACS